MLEMTAEQRVLLSHCTWETYERILSEHVECSSPRFTYSDGALEIMSPSPEHEELNEALKQLVLVASEEFDLECLPMGATTQRRVELHKGVEPDASYYFGDEPRDPAQHAPDLVVEIEISRSALDKLPIFAEWGIPEVWRCTLQGVQILTLHEGAYVPAERSVFLPLTASGISEQLAARGGMQRRAWLAGLRIWLRG